MKSQAIVNYGAPLEEVESELPTPTGNEVLIEISHCGVCHSDVHFHDGYFDMGGGEKLDVTRARKTPFTLGHEIEGIVVAVGDTVKNVKVGERKVIYPWIGCGDCPDCHNDREHYCTGRALGVRLPGGFSSHCLVPEEHYCLDADGIEPGLASTYMCSGITAYAALKHLKPMDDNEPVLIMGLGGVGMMALQFALQMLNRPVLVADLDENKLQAAMGAGAHAAYNPKDPEALAKLQADTNGGVGAAVDFVGAESSLAFASAALRRGGEAKVVGLFGGAFQMPIPYFPFRAISIGGSMTGSLADTIEMLEIVKAGKINPIPVEMRDMSQASQTLDDLREGKIIGRVVLTN
ncbi:MAG: alcohol dehydrogenase [Parvibaculales bacterium]|jgi:D-arabinose 1-dehydrogenase-like Zn-dependent alcohol dehydrogenase